jgi:DNA-binding response OmpR family regulator
VKTRTILVADDDPGVSKFVKTCLEQAGFRVLLACDGEAAMLLYGKYRATIRMLLIDVMMPKISGLELADHVLKHEPETPILFMSGSHWDATRGFGCLGKPFDSAQLIGRISDVLMGAPANPKNNPPRR